MSQKVNQSLSLLIAVIVFPFCLGAYAALSQLSPITNHQPDISYRLSKSFPPLPDFSAYKDVKQKKLAFFTYLQTLAVAANQSILAERKQIRDIYHRQYPTKSDIQTLQTLAEKYRIKWPEKESFPSLDDFLQKVDTIPLSLVLAQAANESAWGTSRFARQGNNLFGQWCFTKGCGIIPKYRNKGDSHEVEAFNSAYDSVESYMLNLNRNSQYAKLRLIRQQLKQQGKAPDGEALSQGLNAYSERGKLYTEELSRIIRQNNLSRLDKLS